MNKPLMLVTALLLAGCGHLDEDQVRAVVRKCVDAGGLPIIQHGIFNDKADVACRNIKP